jgi:hypothetical protein
MTTRSRVARAWTPLIWGAAAALYCAALSYGAWWWVERRGAPSAPSRSASAPRLASSAPARQGVPPAARDAAKKAPRQMARKAASASATARRPQRVRTPAARARRPAKLGSLRPAPAVAYRKVVAAGVPLHIVQSAALWSAARPSIGAA